jgi:hypothetical protein
MDLRKAILEAQDSELRKVHVSEWGVDVFIGVMTAGERDSWENEWLQKQGKGGVENFRAKFLGALSVRRRRKAVVCGKRSGRTCQKGSVYRESVV